MGRWAMSEYDRVLVTKVKQLLLVFQCLFPVLTQSTLSVRSAKETYYGKVQMTGGIGRS